MSSTNVDSEQKASSLSIQDIIKEMEELQTNLANYQVAEADSPPQQTTTNSTSAADQTGKEQDGSNNIGDVSQGQGNNNDTNNQVGDVSHGHGNSVNDANKQDGDVTREKQGDVGLQGDQEMKNTVQENNGRKEVQHELDKLSKELQYMIRSFQKLAKFETELEKPLETLKANVKDITSDLPQVIAGGSAKQVQLNLRVLRDNLTKVKILIPLQHQTANTASAANRVLQTTVATKEAEDLPHLFDEKIFEGSYHFQEFKEKYEALEDREKLCLFCFSIFPENAEIKKRLLRFWWVGEKLVRGESSDKEKEQVNKILEDFVNKGFIQPVHKKNKLQPRVYTMSPIVRSCLIKFAQKERFFDYDAEGKPTMDFSDCKKACMVKSQGIPDGWFSEYLKGSTAGTKEKTAAETNRLPADLVKLQMLFNFPDRNTLKETSLRFDKLQTLFNISKQFPALPKEWFSKMTGINVLYLGSWESSARRQRHIEVEDLDFFKGFKNMKKLRLLSLQGISGITKLPSTICKLENLRILDARACHNLEKLPDRIGLLKKLTYLDLSECYLLDSMPKQLNELSELQVFKGFVISGDKNWCTLDELSKLENLRKLSVNVHTTKFDIDDAGNALSEFKNLEKLKIAWASGGKENKGEDGSDNMKNKLSRSGTKTKLLRSFTGIKSSSDKKKAGEEDPKSPNKLVKLELQCFPRSEPPKWLEAGKMSSLRHLCIRGGKLAYLKKPDENKWKAEKLRLKFLMDFKMNWKEMLEEFPELNHLEMAKCPRITFCPCDDNGVWKKSSVIV